jgi:hypothetical protein
VIELRGKELKEAIAVPLELVACFEHLFFDLVDKSLREEANKRQKRE